MTSTAASRLTQERKRWRTEHPPDFWAKPRKNQDESSNIMVWEAGIPGKVGTDWEGGVYRVVLKFFPEYPSKGPYVCFDPVIFHPNVFSNGEICLSILKDQPGGWQPSVNMTALLLGTFKFKKAK